MARSVALRPPRTAARAAGVWAFGDHVLDEAERRLTRRGGDVGIPPKALDLLIALVESGGSLLSKTVLMERLWPDVVVGEGTLARHVSFLRKVLADGGAGGTLIQTVHKSGYRFRGEVRAVASGSDEAGPPAAPVPLAPLPAEPDAYVAYLRGRCWWGHRTPAALRKSLHCFEDAVARDPGCAAAHAALADALALLAGYVLPPSVCASARAAAEHALALDPDLADAHAARGLVAQKGDRDWAGAEEAYRRALQLQPRHVTALQRCGELLALRGRFDEGLALLRRARQIDPVSGTVGADLAKAYFHARRYREAIMECLQVLELDADFVRARLYIGLSEVMRGRHAVAAGELKAFVRGEPSPYALGVLAFAQGAAGELEGSRQVLEQLEKRKSSGYVTPYALVLAHLGVGDREAALERLAEVVEGGHDVLTLGRSPLLDALRGERRFRDLLRRARLAPDRP